MTSLNLLDQSTVDTILAMPLAADELPVPSSAKVEIFKRLASYVGGHELANSILNRATWANFEEETATVYVGGRVSGALSNKWELNLSLGDDDLPCGRVRLRVSSAEGHTFSIESGRPDNVARVLGLRA